MFKDLNKRIRVRAEKNNFSHGILNVEHQIQSTDPILWDMICTLTISGIDKCNHRHSLVYNGDIKNLRRLFILHIIMFCVDKTCSMPFHVLLTDVIDSHSGGSELIRIFNRLGICVRFPPTNIATVVYGKACADHNNIGYYFPPQK